MSKIIPSFRFLMSNTSVNQAKSSLIRPVSLCLFVAIFGLPNCANAQRGGWLIAKISEHHVLTEETIELQEAMLLMPGTGVVSIQHEIWRTGIYHRELSRFVLLHDGSHQKVFPIQRSTSDLPESIVSPHGFPLQEFRGVGWVGGGWLGKTFRFTFIDPGVYVITVQWRLETRGQVGEARTMRSNPVIVFVKPSSNYDRVARRRREVEGPDDQHGLDLQERLERYYNDHHSAPEFNGVVLPSVFEDHRNLPQ